MHLTRKVFFIGLLFSVGTLCFAQARQTIGKGRDSESYDIENVYGASTGTNSGLISSLFFRHSNSIDDNNLMHYGFELANTRHPREFKQTTITGNAFVIGKSNFLISLRPNYGREKILFKKAPQQGVRISGMISGGPTIGLETPYYVNMGGRSVKYSPEIPFSTISGNSGAFRGLFESKIVPGAHLKASLTFETNSTKNRVFGIQTGFIVEGFTRKIEILSNADNKSLYTQAFIALYFGKRR